MCVTCIYEGLNIAEEDVLTESLCTKSTLFTQYKMMYDYSVLQVGMIYCKYVYSVLV
jgi:hypothetical protein